MTVAQPIQGTVSNERSGKPLSFANIVVLGQSKGTISNIEGHFVLEVARLSVLDTILFSYIGFHTLKVSVDDLVKSPDVQLKVATITLDEIQILSRELTVEEILDSVTVRYPVNHPPMSHRQRVFFHDFERTPFSEENKILMKKSDFVGLDVDTFNELFALLPDEFVEYQDAVVELYSVNNEHKVLPIQAVSLEEYSMQDLQEKIESRMGEFFNDIENSSKEEDVYYKFKTGIIGFKADAAGEDQDSISDVQKKDSLHYIIQTETVKNEMLFLLRDYANIESKNWEFVTKPNKYNYKMEDVTVLNDELVYAISFTPKRKGLYEGQIFVSTHSFAVLQLDFAYSEGKQNEKIQLLGFGHSMNQKEGRVIFERNEESYYIKYIYAHQHETASIDRKFTVMKKKKRRFFDKGLNKIKLSADLTFDIKSFWEVLVLDREKIDTVQFNAIDQPKTMKFKKEYSYSPEIWKDQTIIAPASQLQKYKRVE